MKDYKIIFIGMLIALGLVIYNGYIQKNSTSNLVETNGNRAKYEILVDVEESKLYLFENGELKKEYKCSGGKWSTPSPIGTWTVTSKAKWGEGFGRELAWT